ncbi:DUF4105 domain-containing protein [Leptospira idonii]|uniref:DUF4105 domain-containing protein n=1 Tax=Leptospira idonii TaxID=1193500 RepID=A0A4V3JYD4_9LEPT|nr:DUF4105 domain-containing protein [Leptospira idonii]TGN20666.1 DUF4105 domain-containing protein [Leptospira idonii]
MGFPIYVLIFVGFFFAFVSSVKSHPNLISQVFSGQVSKTDSKGALSHINSLDRKKYIQELIGKIEEHELYDTKHWKRLLRYKKNLLGKETSEIDSKAYFFSLKGNTNPKEEMISTLLSFFEEEPEDPSRMHPQCFFPERFFWMNSILHFDSSLLTFRKCSRFEEWKKVLDLDHIRLVFASYYMQAPASMFGHSFFKMNSRNNQSSELLDYGVNFAADPGEISPISYMIGGLTGGYPGKFGIFPYYLKINEYNHLEGRDLWEYKLKLNEEEKERFLRHLWEMGRADFDYYFLTANCAYQLIQLLEVAKPSLEINAKAGKIVTPSGTMELVFQENDLVEEIVYRPSLNTKIRENLNVMRDDEKRMFFRLFGEGEKIASEIKKEDKVRKTLVLDTLLLSWQYGSLQSDSGKEHPGYGELLSERSKLAEETVVLPERKPFPPHHAHSLSRVSLGYGNSSLGNFSELQYRIAYHDLLNSSRGQSPHSELEFFSTKLRNYEGGRQEWTSMDVLKLSSLSPYDSVTRKLSYSFRFGWDTALVSEKRKFEFSDLFWKEKDPIRRQAANLDVMAGYSFANPFFGKEENSIFSLLGGISAQGSSYFHQGQRFGPQVSGQYLHEWGDFKIHFLYGYRYYAASGNEDQFTSGIKLRYSLSKDHELRFEYGRQKRYDECFLSYHYLF